MDSDQKDLEIAELKEVITSLRVKSSQAELSEQRLRDARSKVDAQLEKFTQIHNYTMKAFAASGADEVFSLAAEAVVDIFQIECGAVFSVNIFDNTLTLESQCNLESDPAPLSLPEDWIKEHGLWQFHHSQASFESPVASQLWQNLGLAHIVFAPMFDNDRRLAAVLIGGISRARELFYEFTPREILSPFIVFTQQINGIVSNMAAINRAQQNAEAKNRFLANLSHEIRTPMNAILGMVQLAQGSNDLSEIQDFIKQIDGSSNHLLALLNDVLDFSKIEENKLVLAEEDFDLKTVVENLIRSVGPNARRKKQSLNVDYRGLSSFCLQGDSLKLSQVLLNLLSNAVKFTPEGGRIDLLINEVNREGERVFLRFEVNDTGIGLSEEFLERIFKPFEQADSGISRKYGGTGLGLAISQHIIELMGGSIKAENKPGGGAGFSFYVWFEVGECAEEETAPVQGETGGHGLEGLKALIVDDVDLNRTIAAAFLKKLGISSVQAGDGRQAAEIFQTSIPGTYDFILMDLQMPVLDGVSATKEIRASDHPDAGNIVILAMTANVFKEDVTSAMKAGMDGYISKPIKMDSFVDTLRKALEH